MSEKKGLPPSPETKPTAGPWRFVSGKEEQPVPYYSGIIALVAQEPYLTVVTDGRVAQSYEWEANARLIAAAPDMKARIVARLESCPCAMPKPSSYEELLAEMGLCSECEADIACLTKAAGR